MAPYATFGTPELAGHVLDALDGKTAALMANHGALVHAARHGRGGGASLCCSSGPARVYWRAATLGTPRTLDDEELGAVLSAVVERGYGGVRAAAPGGAPG